MNAHIISKKNDVVTMQVQVKLTNSMLQTEENIQVALNETGNIITSEALEYFDTDGSPITIGSIKLTSKGLISKEYQTPFGAIEVDRHVYQSSEGGKTYCPLEKDAHIILASTPRFAKMISSKYSRLGAPHVCRDFEENHKRKVVLSCIQQVANLVGSLAQATEEKWTYSVPKLESHVEIVTVGLDGTTMLMCKEGWREAMTGTISLFDEFGERLHTIYIGATPEYGKAIFLDRLDTELTYVKQMYPDATYVGLADGAPVNWEFLEKRTDIQTLDFWHASEYLTKVADAAFPKKIEERKFWLDEACHKLKHNKTGADVIMKDMRFFIEEKPLTKDAQEKIAKSLTYFKNHKTLMNYSDNAEENYPIGSGVTEAACKVIVKERLCCSGMRWKEEGAAGVIALRCLNYSTGRWEQFWEKIDRYGVPEVECVH